MDTETELVRTDRPEHLLPAESLVFAVALTQSLDGRDTDPNITVALLLTIKRLTLELTT